MVGVRCSLFRGVQVNPLRLVSLLLLLLALGVEMLKLPGRQRSQVQLSAALIGHAQNFLQLLCELQPRGLKQGIQFPLKLLCVSCHHVLYLIQHSFQARLLLPAWLGELCAGVGWGGGGVGARGRYYFLRGGGGEGQYENKGAGVEEAAASRT